MGVYVGRAGVYVCMCVWSIHVGGLMCMWYVYVGICVYGMCTVWYMWNGRVYMCCMCVGRYICGGELVYMGYCVWVHVYVECVFVNVYVNRVWYI